MIDLACHHGYPNSEVGRRPGSKDSYFLDAVRHRLARVVPISNAFELSRLRVRLELLEAELNAAGVSKNPRLAELHSDCLKAIAALALAGIRTR